MTYKKVQKHSENNLIGVKSEKLLLSNLQKRFNSHLPLTISVKLEIDFGCYFYTVRYGAKALGIFTRNLNSDFYFAKVFYHNPDNLKTQHQTEEEAIAAIVGAYLGQTSFLSIKKPAQATYNLTLETKELDEFGIPTEHRLVVKKNSELEINWHQWVLSYSEVMGEPYRVTHVVRVDNKQPAEF